MRRVSQSARPAGRLRFSFAALLPFPILLAACSGTPMMLGQRPEGVPAAIRSLAQAAPKSQVVVSGTMIEKCPVAGCWFVLRDGTGQVRVDTRAAGFVVAEVPLKTQVTVVGSVQREEGLTSISALGARY